MKRAVLFDLFDTLIERRASAGGHQAGVPLEIASAFREVWDSWGDLRMTAPVSYEELVEEAFRRAGVAPAQGRVRELARARAATKERQFRDIPSEVLAMVEGCRDEGFRIAVVSGCAVDDVAAWPVSLLATIVDVTAFSFDLGCSKPEPEVYYDAFRRLDVSPADAVFVDDNPQCVDGARAVGISALVRAAWFVNRATNLNPGEFIATSPNAALRYIIGSMPKD